MKISIVTAAYNSVAAIRETIESVLSQDYPNIEYVVTDGGSKDGTVEILKSYGDKIKWVSEKDCGIFEAISKEVKMATGDTIGIVGSDDFYPNNKAISKIVKAFKEPNADSVYGDLHYVDSVDTTKITRNWKSGNYSRERFFEWLDTSTYSFFLKKIGI